MNEISMYHVFSVLKLPSPLMTCSSFLICPITVFDRLLLFGFFHPSNWYPIFVELMCKSLCYLDITSPTPSMKIPGIS